MLDEVSEFPWGTLPVLTARDVELERRFRREVLHDFELGRARQLVQELFGAELQGFGVVEAGPLHGGSRSLGAELGLRFAHGRVQLSVESSLVELLVSRVLGRELFVSTGAPLGPSLQGAFEAIALEVARRLGRGAPPAAAPVLETHVASEPRRAWRVDFWVRLDDASYAARLLWSPTSDSSLGCDEPQQRRAPTALAVPVTLPLVLALSQLSLAELMSLEVGDCVVLEGAQEPAAPFAGTLWLCAGRSDRALAVSVGPRGLQLKGPARLEYDGVMTNDGAQNTTTVDQVVLDAPLVVRVEVAEVTLPARDWLSLQPGDVVATDAPLGQSVVLRVAGSEVARGTLVNVEGKLAVRITELSSSGAAPAR